MGMCRFPRGSRFPRTSNEPLRRVRLLHGEACGTRYLGAVPESLWGAATPPGRSRALLSRAPLTLRNLDD